MCPGFGWDRDNFHKKPGRLTQVVNQMGYSIPCDILLGIEVGKLAGNGNFATQEQAEHQVVRKLHSVYPFYQHYCCYHLLPLVFC